MSTTVTSPLQRFRKDAATCSKEGASSDWGSINGDHYLDRQESGSRKELGTGTQIGTAVSQKLGFYGATPVVQPSGVDQAAVTLGNVDGEIGGLTISDPPSQAEIQALRDACEELADDLRALSTLVHALLYSGELIRGEWSGLCRGATG